jgi:glycerol dehydrogenase
MATPSAFSPQDVYGRVADEKSKPPGVLIFPHRYIQGPDTLDFLGNYISVLPSIRPAVLISAGGRNRFGDQLQKSFQSSGIEFHTEIFDGECAFTEIDRLFKRFKRLSPPADALIAVGGGKCLDTGKCVAYRLGIPVVICPTIASTDAPCSAVSVVYSPDGVQIGPEFFPSSPALVVVDTRIIMNAPVRQLVSGMGDALATYFEARTCYENPSARSMVGGRVTMTALTLARLCADTILENGLAAVASVRANRIDEAFEKVVEANTLLSGVGFESGGLAVAHAVAGGLTVIPSLHRDFYHGELVGIGILVQLLLEKKRDEAQKVGTFLAKIGLPVHAGQLDMDPEKHASDIQSAMVEAEAAPLILAEPFPVTSAQLVTLFTQAHQLGMQIIRDVGDEAYCRLHIFK